MTSEKQMRSNVVKLLRRAGLDARPVENAVDPGFPDVEYIGGVLELKAAAAWPKRPETKLELSHYTQNQRIWHERRSHFGGRCHVLLQVDREYLLFTGVVAAASLGNVSRSALYDLACARWDSLADLLTGLAPALLK